VKPEPQPNAKGKAAEVVQKEAAKV
jgi:hypothetical protein